MSVAAALGAVLANLAFVTVRWRILLRAAGFALPVRRLLSAICAGLGANNLLPARGGDLVRLESMRQVGGIPPFVGVGALFAERLLDGLVLSVWILAGALLAGKGGVLLLTGVALSAGTGVELLLVALVAARPERASRAAAGVAGRLPARWRGSLESAAGSFVAGLGAFRDRRTLAGLLLSSTAAYVLTVHAFVVLPVTVLGIALLRIALPALGTGMPLRLSARLRALAPARSA